jgi:hypothetical protein
MSRHPTPLHRLLAWIVTGPVGHFVAGTLDLAGAIAQIASERARRERGEGRPA